MARVERRAGRRTAASVAAANLWIGRYPGPVWTMILWGLLSLMNVGFALLRPSAAFSSAGLAVRLSVLVYVVVTTVVLVVLAGRTPDWLLRFMVGMSVLIMAVYTATAPSALSASMISWGYVAIAGYAAYWWGRAFTMWVVVAASASLLLALQIAGHLPMLAPLWLVATSVMGALAVVLHQLIRRLDDLIVKDPLTGLLNRRGLDALIRAQPTSGRVTSPRCLAVVDLDGLKRVNDRDGHAAGDNLLRTFGELLRDGLRADDVAVRSGGDEFVLILPQTTPDEARQLLDRIRSRAAVSFSYGVADYTGARDFDQVMAQADAGMYADKRHRRG